MGPDVAWAVLLTGWVLGGVRAGEARATSAPVVLPELASPYQQYELKLRVFYPAPRCPAGTLLPMRINGGRRLLLVPTVLNGKQSGRVMMDTGASSSAISRQAARALSGSPILAGIPSGVLKTKSLAQILVSSAPCSKQNRFGICVLSSSIQDLTITHVSAGHQNSVQKPHPTDTAGAHPA